MTLATLLELARTLRDEGDAVFEQFEAVVNGEALDEQNPNALRIIAGNLRTVVAAARADGDGELAEDADEWLDEIMTHLMARRRNGAAQEA